MQITNLLSEAFLTFSGFLTFYFLLRKLPMPLIILWRTFILAVSTTSFFSALYFAGFNETNIWHEFFKKHWFFNRHNIPFFWYIRSGFQEGFFY
jgi:hypothetical protein